MKMRLQSARKFLQKYSLESFLPPRSFSVQQFWRFSSALSLQIEDLIFHGLDLYIFEIEAVEQKKRMSFHLKSSFIYAQLFTGALPITLLHPFHVFQVCIQFNRIELIKVIGCIINVVAANVCTCAISFTDIIFGKWYCNSGGSWNPVVVRLRRTVPIPMLCPNTTECK